MDSTYTSDKHYYTITLSGNNIPKYDTYKLNIKLPELG